MAVLTCSGGGTGARMRGITLTLGDSMAMPATEARMMQCGHAYVIVASQGARSMQARMRDVGADDIGWSRLRSG